MRTQFEVIVIGAGVAGLAAGRTLAAAGRRVAIVEAREYVGGRIRTKHAGAPLELGAEFIHGQPAASWSLIREADLETYELQGQSYTYENATLQTASPLADEAFKVIVDMARWWTRQTAPADLSFSKYLNHANLPTSEAERARRYVEGFNAADATDISVAALARQQRAEDDIQADRVFHVVGGYDTVPEFLVRRFRSSGGQLFLSHEVNSVEWDEQGVRVSGANPAFDLSAHQAVVTLPLGVLKADQVRFSPQVPALGAALGGLVMGDVLRVSFLFDRPFWTTTAAGMGFLFSPDQPIPTWWSSHPDSAPVLTAWVGGRRAYRRLGSLRGQALIDAALEQLQSMFALRPATLKRMLQATATHDWSADPYARGAYSYASVGGLNASSTLAAPVGRSLYFAGEHTDGAGHWGTVHAALASGQRAAEQILLNSV